MDAITLLKQDHKTVEQLFKKFEKAGDRAHKAKRDLVDQITKELSIHAAIEEQVFYPAARQGVPDAEDMVLEGLEEHHIVKRTLGIEDAWSDVMESRGASERIRQRSAGGPDGRTRPMARPPS